MANYEVKKVGIFSILRVVPIVVAMLGAVIGIFTFFVVPTELAANLGFGAKFLSFLLFVFLYTVLMTIGVLLLTWFFNIVAGKFGKGITFELEQVEE